jgi:hypothetical protein
LELFLKGITVIFGSKPWGHNLTKIPLNLSIDLKNMASPFIFKKIIPEDMEEDIEKFGGIQKVNNIMLENFQSKLHTLSLKYNKHTYLKGFEKEDESNLFLRYPIDKEFDTLIKSVDEVELKKDFDDLFNIILYFIAVYTDSLLEKPLSYYTK